MKSNKKSWWLTLISYQELENCWWNLVKLHAKEIKRGRRSWRKLDGAEENGEIKKTGDNSRENMKNQDISFIWENYTLILQLFKIYQSSPSVINLINSILVPMIFPSQNTSHENSNLPLIQNYHFTPPNRQILFSTVCKS